MGPSTKTKTKGALRHHLAETLSHIPTICQLYPDYIHLAITKHL